MAQTGEAAIQVGEAAIQVGEEDRKMADSPVSTLLGSPSSSLGTPTSTCTGTGTGRSTSPSSTNTSPMLDTLSSSSSSLVLPSASFHQSQSASSTSSSSSAKTIGAAAQAGGKQQNPPFLGGGGRGAGGVIHGRTMSDDSTASRATTSGSSNASSSIATNRRPSSYGGISSPSQLSNGALHLLRPNGLTTTSTASAAAPRLSTRPSNKRAVSYSPGTALSIVAPHPHHYAKFSSNGSGHPATAIPVLQSQQQRHASPSDSSSSTLHLSPPSPYYRPHSSAASLPERSALIDSSFYVNPPSPTLQSPSEQLQTPATETSSPIAASQSISSAFLKPLTQHHPVEPSAESSDGGHEASDPSAPSSYASNSLHAYHQHLQQSQQHYLARTPYQPFAYADNPHSAPTTHQTPYAQQQALRPSSSSYTAYDGSPAAQSLELPPVVGKLRTSPSQHSRFSSFVRSASTEGKGKERSRDMLPSESSYSGKAARRHHSNEDGEEADLDGRETEVTSDAGASSGVRETTKLSSAKDAQGRKMINQYARVAEIGKGVHGRVWLCEDTETEEFYAIKCVNRENRKQRSLRRSQAEAESTRRRLTSNQEETSTRLHDELMAELNPPHSPNRERDIFARQQSLERGANASFDEDMQLVPSPSEQQVLSPLARKRGGLAGNEGAGSRRKRPIVMDEKVKQEIAIMKRSHHPNVVQLREVIDDQRSKKIFMVLEYMPGGQIEWTKDDKPTMTVDESRSVFRDVVLGLEYLHYQGIIHRDIKPANLLWTQDRKTVKITDFGVSHVSEALARTSAANPSTGGRVGLNDDRALRKTEGSPAFFAPELCAATDGTPVATPVNELEKTASRPDYFRRPTTGKSGLSGSGESSPRILTGAGSTRPASNQRGGSTRSVMTISQPLSVQQQQQAAHRTRSKERPTVGKGIDVWALGVTLYCFLFGRTPFHEAVSEYELYNMIPRKEIVIPPRMGADGLRTGSDGLEGEGDDDGEEGREVVDLLGRLLEKDPQKRIQLHEVKKHPWVLRNLGDSQGWLAEHDLADTGVVSVTAEEVQHATNERTAPQLPHNPLKASFRRFGEIFGLGGANFLRRSTAGQRRDRSKSVSSTSASITTASAWDGKSEPSRSRAASRQASLLKKRASTHSTRTGGNAATSSGGTTTYGAAGASAGGDGTPLQPGSGATGQVGAAAEYYSGGTSSHGEGVGSNEQNPFVAHAISLKRKLANHKAALAAHESALSASSASSPTQPHPPPASHWHSSLYRSSSASGESNESHIPHQAHFAYLQNDPNHHALSPPPMNERRASLTHLVPPMLLKQRRVSSGGNSADMASILSGPSRPSSAVGPSTAFTSPTPSSRPSLSSSVASSSAIPRSQASFIASTPHLPTPNSDNEGKLTGGLRNMWRKIRSGSRTPAAGTANNSRRNSKMILSPVNMTAVKSRDMLTAGPQRVEGATQPVTTEIKNPDSRSPPTQTSGARSRRASSPLETKSDAAGVAVPEAFILSGSISIPASPLISPHERSFESTIAYLEEQALSDDSSDSLSDDFDGEDDYGEELSPAVGQDGDGGDITQPSSYGQGLGPAMFADASHGWQTGNPAVVASDPLAQFYSAQQSQQLQQPPSLLASPQIHTLSMDTSPSPPPESTPKAVHRISLTDRPEELDTKSERQGSEPVKSQDENQRPAFSRDGSLRKEYSPVRSPARTEQGQPRSAAASIFQLATPTIAKKGDIPNSKTGSVDGHRSSTDESRNRHNAPIEDDDDDEEEEEVMIKPRSRFRRGTNTSHASNSNTSTHSNGLPKVKPNFTAYPTPRF